VEKLKKKRAGTASSSSLPKSNEHRQEFSISNPLSINRCAKHIRYQTNALNTGGKHIDQIME
jgi:hypothetical protein